MYVCVYMRDKHEKKGHVTGRKALVDVMNEFLMRAMHVKFLFFPVF